MIPLEKIIVLNQIPLFAPLNTEEIRLIAEITVEDHRRAGEALFNIGEEGGRMYIVISGGFEVFNPSDGQTLRAFDANSVIGETTLFDQGPRLFSVRCTADSELLIIEQSDLETLIHRAPAIAIGLLKVFSHRQFQ